MEIGLKRERVVGKEFETTNSPPSRVINLSETHRCDGMMDGLSNNELMGGPFVTAYDSRLKDDERGIDL